MVKTQGGAHVRVHMIRKMWGFPRGLGPWGGRWWWSCGLGSPWTGGALWHGPRWNGAL